jgi:hypothetical protein
MDSQKQSQKQSGQFLFESLLMLLGIAMLLSTLFKVISVLQIQFADQQIYKDKTKGPSNNKVGKDFRRGFWLRPRQEEKL